MQAAPPVDDVAQCPDKAWDHLCPACAYALTGLPPAGTCPECGRAYTRDVVVLYGYGRGAYANVSTARPRSLIWFGLLAAINIVPALGGPSAAVWSLVVFAVVSFGTEVWLRRSHSHPGTVQARFNRLGCVQHSSVVDAGARTISYLILGGVSIFWFGSAASQGPGAVWGALVAFSLLGLITVATHWARRRRRDAIERRDRLAGLTDDLHTALPTGWPATGRVSAERTGDEGRYRLRVESQRPTLNVPPIDIEVESTAERIGALVQQIRAWQAARAEPA